jgi:hypothetical protein
MVLDRSPFSPRMEGAETTGFTRMSVEELKSGVGAPLSGTKNCMIESATYSNVLYPSEM